MRPSRLHLAMLAVLAAVAPACGIVTGDDDDASPVQPTLPASTALLRVAAFDWPSCLNPLTCDDPAARSLVWEHVLPKLLEVGADGEYVASPVLAGMPEVRVDPDTGAQTVTYVIDPEARWHDGRPITSSDVTGTWMARQATPGALTGGYELITAVDDRDPLVARVTLSRPYADWPELFGGDTGYLLEADAFAGDLDLSGRFDDELGFGAGPFALASVNDRAIVLDALQDHWAAEQQAAVDQVRIERMPADSSEELDDSIPGGVDLVVPSASATVETDRFRIVKRPSTDVVGLFLDRRSPPLGSLAVRLAVHQVVDRRMLPELLGADDLVTCAGLLPQQDSCGDQLADEVSSSADAILEADGWTRDPSGARTRPGLPLLVPVSYDPDLPGAVDVARAIVEQLEPLGFGVVLQATDRATWLQGGRTGSTGIGVFAASLGTAEQLAALHRCEALVRNPMGWCEPANQELTRRLVITPRLDERRVVAAELAELVADTVSWIPVSHRTTPLLVDPSRTDVPEQVPLGSGPLGGLHRVARVDA